jgi:CDP-2,3-bis-(O-geranylgeranyl)-sn-glycerol synthase
MANIFVDLFFALWFFLPAGMANMIPILVAKMPGLRRFDAPIDGGRTYKGKRIFGAHKTWRGLATGIIMATLILWLQQWAIAHVALLQDLTDQVNYAHLSILIVGPLFGLGALGGDAIESFFKRQRGVAPGNGWFPFDQTDYIIGGAITTAPFVQLHFWQYIELLLLWLFVHIVASYVGFLLHLKDKPI